MKKAVFHLNFMYSMERFATALYRMQMGAFKQTSLFDKLTYATDNEGQHAANLKSRIVALHYMPSPFAVLFQILGIILGLLSRCFGKLFMLKLDTAIEKKAVKDYSYFLRTLKLDGDSSALIKNIIGDEELHIKNWQDAIKILKD